MKTIRNIALLTLTVILVSGLGVNAQKSGSAFKGVIMYKVSYPDSKMDASQQAMLPQTLKLTLDNEKSRIDITMAQINQTVLLNSELKTTAILLEAMGQKIAMKPNKKAITKEPVVNVTTETKEIAGYLCKKAEISFGDEKSKANPVIVYYTEAIGNNKIFYDNEYQNLPGIPMEFQYKMQGMSMLLTASSVEKGKVSKNEFEIPSDYKEMTPEQLKEMFGGGK